MQGFGHGALAKNRNRGRKGLDRLQDLGTHRLRRTPGADLQSSEREIMLRDRHKKKRLERAVKLAHAAIPDDANDGDGLLGVAGHCELPAQRILARPKVFGHCLVDDRDVG